MSEDLTLIVRMRDEATKVLQNVERELRETGSVTKEMAAQLKLNNQAMKDADAIAARLGRTTGTAGGIFRRTAADLNDMHGAGLRVSSSLMGVVRAYGPLLGFAGGFLAISAGAKSAVGASVEFEKSLRDIQALVGESRQQIDQWVPKMKDMAVQFGRSPKEVADAMYFITSSGFSGSQALDVLQASAKAAGAGMGDMMTIADAATSAVNAYGKENLTAADAIGIMLTAVKDGKMEPQELAASMGQALGVASAMGVKFQDVAAAVASLSLSGMKSAEAVTTVRQTLLNISAPSQEARKTLDELAKKTNDTSISFANLQKTFKDQGYLAGINKLGEISKLFKGDQQDSFLRKILNDVQAVNAAKLLTGANADMVKGIFEDVGKSGAKSLEDAWKAAASSTATTFAQFKAMFQTTMLDIGDKITPALTKGMSAIVALFSHMTEVLVALLPVVAAYTTNLVVNTAAKLANWVATQRMIVAESQLMAAQTARGLMGPIALDAIKQQAAGMGLLQAAVGRVGLALRGLWATMLANPYTAIIVAVVAVGAALYEFRDTLVHTKDGVTSLGDIITATWPALKNVARETWTSISGEVAGAADDISKSIQPLTSWVAQQWEYLRDITQKHWGEISEAIRESVNFILTTVPGLSLISGLLDGYWQQAYNATRKWWSGIGDVVREGVKSALGIAAMLPGIGFLAGGAALGVKLQGEISKEAVKQFQTRQTEQFLKTHSLAPGMNPPGAPPPPPGGDGNLDLDNLKDRSHKKKGGKEKLSEQEKDYRDQQKALADHLIQMRKLQAEADELGGVAIIKGMMTIAGGTPLDVKTMEDQQDALAEKRKKAVDRAIDAGKKLNDINIDAIQLTDKEKQAIAEKAKAELHLASVKTINANINDMRKGVADAEAETKAINDQTEPTKYLSALEEQRAKARAAYLDRQRESLSLTDDEIEAAKKLVDADIKRDLAKRGRDAETRAEFARQDTSQQLQIGFGDSLAAQQSRAVWAATLEARKKYGDLTLELTPKEIAAIRAETAETWKLSEAQEAFNNKKQEASEIFDAFGSFFHDAVLGTKSWKAALGDMLKALAEIIFQYGVLIPLKHQFEAGFGGGGGGGVMGFLGSALSGLLGGLSGGGFNPGTLGTSFSVTGGGAPVVIPSAKGNVFSHGDLVPFAGGGVFDSPVMFPMRGGKVGQMAEAGPEAIMPLARDSSGRLGVRGGGGGTHVFAPTVQVTVESNGEEDPESMGRMIGDAVEAKMAKFAQKEMRPGGMFYNGARR